MATRWQRFIGPLAAAATSTASGCATSVPDWAILAGLGTALVSVLMYFGIRERTRIPITLPHPFTMVTGGMSHKAWRAFLKYIVHNVRGEGLHVKGDTIYLKNGTRFPFSNEKLSGQLFHLDEGQARRMVYAWAMMDADPLADPSDADQVINLLDRLYIDFSNMMLEPFDDVTGRKFTDAFGQLFIRRCAYQRDLWELVDLFEPALLTRYFTSRGQHDAAAIMRNMLTGETAELTPEDVASLLPDITSEDVPDETRVVNALIHMYYGRKLLEVYGTYVDSASIKQGLLRAIFGHLNSAEKIVGKQTPIARNPGLLRAGVEQLADYLGMLREEAESLWNVPDLPVPSALWNAHMISSTASILKVR